MQAAPSLPPLRDVTEWRAQGLPLGTTSNEAAKLLDALLYQMYGMYQADEFGGIEGTFQRLQAADPELTFVHIFQLEQSVGRRLGNWAPLNASTAAQCDKLQARVPVVNEWERRHIQAMIAKVNGHDLRAAQLWEDNLALHPNDLISGLNMFEHSIHSGDPAKMCFSFGQLSRNANKSDPYLGFYQARLGFGLTESGQHEKAASLLNQSLSHNSWDPWAHHSYAHVDDALGEHRQGWTRLRNHRKDWEMAEEKSMLHGHNYWHESMFAWALGEKEATLELLDREILSRLSKMPFNAGGLLTLGDAVSILTRMELDEFFPPEEIKQRWDAINDIIARCQLDQESTGTPFYDLHIACSLLAGHRPDKFRVFETNLKQQLEEIRNNPLSSTDTVRFIQCMDSVGSAVLQALEAFTSGNYTEAVDLLYPRRREIYQIGGSNAQRDLFLQVLYHSLGRSRTPINLARLNILLAENTLICTEDKNAPLDRLRAKFHLDQAAPWLK